MRTLPDEKRVSYIIRRYVAAGVGHVIDEATIVGLAETIYAAEHMAAYCEGVLVLDQDRRVMAEFGTVPKEGE